MGTSPPPPPPPPPPPLMHREKEEQPKEETNQPEIPKDGYEWKKYGQKYIMNIQQNRSYFKCRNKRCEARKKVEWPPSNPGRLRIVYSGVHSHPPPQPQSASEQEASALMANQYDLATQMFGPSTSSSSSRSSDHAC